MYIYIHIPFCDCICSYCDFCKILYNNKYINNYLDNLEKEINCRYKNELIKSIYIGGGTPSSLSYQELERLFNIIKIFKLDSNYEFTIECNVNNLDINKIKLFKDNGVNRVSLGVQSFNTDGLEVSSFLYSYNSDITWGIERDKYLSTTDFFKYEDWQMFFPEYLFKGLRMEEAKNIYNHGLLDANHIIDMLDISNTKPLNKENFIGWLNTGDNKLYYPGDKIRVIYGMHFIAKYAK